MSIDPYGRMARKLSTIIARIHPTLKGDKNALAIRLKLAGEMVTDGWVIEHDGDLPSFTTPVLRFGHQMYFAESRYKLTPVPGKTGRGRWKVESLDRPEWARPHPHHYKTSSEGDGLCCYQVINGSLQHEPLHEVLAMAATMSGHVMEDCGITEMKPFADPNLSSAATCPFCKMDVDKQATKCQKNGYHYHPACYEAMLKERD